MDNKQIRKEIDMINDNLIGCSVDCKLASGIESGEIVGVYVGGDNGTARFIVKPNKKCNLIDIEVANCELT